MHILYLPSIGYFQHLLKEKECILHLNDQYSRQTYRNRTEIVGPNGRMSLTIPTQKLDPKDRAFENIKVSYAEPWLKQHWKSFESAYRRSAYFEYYEDKLKPMYNSPKHEYLWEFNTDLIQIVLSMLKLTSEIKINREEAIEKNINYQLLYPTSYQQVFSNKLAFESNLSVIDLIFNLGPQAKSLLT